MIRSAALGRVQRGDLCSGCGGCALVAPEKIGIQVQEPGYARPVQTAALSDDEEQLIRRMCPGLGQSVDAAGRTDHVLWGPYISVYSGHATDPETRFKASSGGALTAILQYLLEAGRVDGVVQIGADTDVPIANVTVLSEDRAAIVERAGSRYAPSSPLADLHQYCGTDKKYAFVGKPCDVAALRALIEARPEYGVTFPYLLSFFCAGVPSLSGARKILATLGTDIDETDKFRYRGHGWPGRATATLKSGEEKSMSYHDSWGGILSKHVQHRCKICADGTGVAADIVCADVWETDDRGYPLFEERDGQSLVMARSKLGLEILESAASTGAVELAAFEIETLAAVQPGQSGRRKALVARLLALRLTGSPVPRYLGLSLMTVALSNTMWLNVKNFLGTLRRRWCPRAQV